MTNVWIIVPTYNEAENLEPLVDRIDAAMETCTPPMDTTVLVVDDDSPDGTGVIANALATSRGDVQVLHRTAKGGIGGAYIAGFQVALAAGADMVVQIDADLSHDPADIPRLIDAARHGADLVLATRYIEGGGTEGWSPLRRFISRSGGRYASSVLGLHVTDPTGGFKCLTARTLRTLDFEAIASRGYAFQIEVTYAAVSAGLRVAEVPIVFRERERGHSKMSAGIAVEALWRVPLMRVRGAASHEPAVSAP